MVLDRMNADAVRMMVAQLSDKQVITVYDAAGGIGPVADLAAGQIRERNLDY